MRIILTALWFVLISTNLSAQSAPDNKISLRVQNTTIEEVLRQIESRYSVRFSYSSNFVSLDRKVNVSARSEPLEQVLDKLFQGTEISYRRIGNIVALKNNGASPATVPAEIVRQAQSPAIRHQKVKGTIVDADSRMPLIGANIRLVGGDMLIGAATDIDGYFTLDKVAVGRQTFEITYLGYESLLIRDLVIISGKETILQIELQESTTQLAEVIVTAGIDKMDPLNEMSLVSARGFTVEETSRYPGSFQDPSRMARSFAGVSTIHDLENKIVIRGNASTSMLWRLEGIDIPNPNHYSDLGAAGGAISMLSSNTLANSDFLTGAFPAEYGNSLSGVFDLKMRNGNNERQENSLYIGAMGIGASTEGPFRDGGKSSYLLNYRYSTLALLDEVGLNPADYRGIPRYQDLSFKFNLPANNAGHFAFFGLVGRNDLMRPPQATPDEDVLRFFKDSEDSKLGVTGLSHFIMLSDRTYLRTVLGGAIHSYNYRFDRYEEGMEKNPGYSEREDYRNLDVRLTSTFNHKFNARNNIRGGLILSGLFYDLDFRFTDLNWRGPRSGVILNDRGWTSRLQSFAAWKHRLDDRWSILVGAHQLYYGLNNSFSIEPRAAAQYKFRKTESFSFGFGLHSYTGEPTTYLFRNINHEAGPTQPFRHAALPKAAHFVFGYERRINPHLRFKAETYFQHLYRVPVSENPEHTWLSYLNILNTYDLFRGDIERIVNKGTGRNVGMELTLEKFFHQGYYYLTTVSIYDSRYTTVDGRTFSTRYNGNYVLNALGGKEWKINRNNLLGVNAKIVLSGGNRFSGIDEERSRDAGYTIYDPDKVNSKKAELYHRVDFSASYSINRPGMTHTFLIDIQNLFNRMNVLEYYYDRSAQRESTSFQAGIIPNIYYMISF